MESHAFTFTYAAGMEERDLPEALNAAEEKTLADIREHGWQVLQIHAGSGDDEREEPWSEHESVQAAYEAEFAYTIGLTVTFSHPEVILVGGWEYSISYLNAVGSLVREGKRFAPRDTSDQVLDGFTVRFDSVGERCRTELLTWASWAVGPQDFEALQLVLPDPSGHWPEDPDYHGRPQPSLSE
jgi:uncharacterized protein DUF4262